MILRHVYYSLLILIPISTLIKSISTCPIPFDIQSKCRCAITEAGRVYIYCARKQLAVIPRFNNSNIIFDELVLSGNRISVVHRNAFNGLKLRKLEFQANPIKTIEANAFTDLANYLEEFVLSTTISSSQLTSTTFLQILSELPNLKRLVLRSFDLADAFKTAENKSGLSSRKLTQLSLQSCSIKQIDDVGTFVHLFPNVERLDLSENRFEYLNIPLVLALKKLKVLILSKNRIHQLNIHPSISPMASSFHPSNSITELDLSYNGIETIDEHIFELISSQLEVLNLRNNELVTEKHLTFLIHLYHLREFYFDYNRLEAINQLYLPLNLKVLSLKNNRLNHINLSILTRLGHLEKLYLSSNRLTQWSSTMNNIFPSLEILELDRNHLSAIASFNAPKLKQLNLDGNHLGQQLDRKIFANVPVLERLQLRDNQIETIDTQAFRNTRLQSLDLANNSLSAIPQLSNLNETLQVLSLRRNQLCTIDENLLRAYQTLTTLELDQNPLHCDCRLGPKDESRWSSRVKLTGQCHSPPERRNLNLIDLPVETLACSSDTLPQCAYLAKIEPETTTTTTSTTASTAAEVVTTKTWVQPSVIADPTTSHGIDPSSTPVTSSTTEELPLEIIRISDFTLTPSADQSQLLIQWELYPALIDETFDDEYRRKYFKRHDINGFKISSTSPVYKMSDLLDVLQRNYSLLSTSDGEVCLFLLRKINYEKYCKQLQVSSTGLPIERVKPSMLVESKQEKQVWYLNDSTRSVLFGSILGILFVLVLLACVILLITRCPYLFACHLRSSKYHRNNDSKSESLLVRPTPTSTVPSWSPAPTSLAIAQQHFYHAHPHSTRPLSYQPSLSTQCTCPTHYQSSNSSSTDTSSHSNPGINYHIYQEILNDDFNAQHYRTCRPLHIDTNSPPTSVSTNSEQCQLCSLSVLV